MKKLIICAMLTAAALLQSSCSLGGSRTDMLNKSNDREVINTRLEQIIAAIENSDKDAMKAMFSESALQEAEDIDGEIEQLLALFPNGIDSWTHIVNEVSEKQNHGKREKSITASYYVYTGDQQYVFAIMDRIINTENPEKVGLFAIDVFDDKNNEFRAFSAGIYIAVE